MPNSKQAAKRLRQAEKRRVQNKSVTSTMKTAMKKVLDADSADEAKKHLPDAMKKVDKAAKRAILHENAAARTKSRLARAANAKA